jgi:hypothetical protein
MIFCRLDSRRAKMCGGSRINRERWVGVACRSNVGRFRNDRAEWLSVSEPIASAAAAKVARRPRGRRRERHRRRRETPLRGLPGATDRCASVQGQVVSERVRAQGIDVAQGRLYLGNFGQGYRTAHDRIVAARAGDHKMRARCVTARVGPSCSAGTRHRGSPPAAGAARARPKSKRAPDSRPLPRSRGRRQSAGSCSHNGVIAPCFSLSGARA